MKLINEIWWIAVDPSGIALWPYLELFKRDVIERLSADHPHWKQQCWRIAKLQVRELPGRGFSLCSL